LSARATPEEINTFREQQRQMVANIQEMLEQGQGMESRAAFNSDERAYLSEFLGAIQTELERYTAINENMFHEIIETRQQLDDELRSFEIVRGMVNTQRERLAEVELRRIVARSEVRLAQEEINRRAQLNRPRSESPPETRKRTRLAEAAAERNLTINTVGPSRVSPSSQGSTRIISPPSRGSSRIISPVVTPPLRRSTRQRRQRNRGATSAEVRAAIGSATPSPPSSGGSNYRPF